MCVETRIERKGEGLSVCLWGGGGPYEFSSECAAGDLSTIQTDYRTVSNGLQNTSAHNQRQNYVITLANFVALGQFTFDFRYSFQTPDLRLFLLNFGLNR